jgi:uncharacterized phage-associated protein
MKNALEIARYFVENGQSYTDLSNLKIQKLLYYAQGFHLALYESPLFLEELEAWDHGPVVPSVYHELKLFGANPVNFQAHSNYQTWDQNISAFLNRILEMFGKYSAMSLRNMTHLESPWIENYNKLSQSIPQQSIKQYFSSRLNEFGFGWSAREASIDDETSSIEADEELLELARQASFAISKRKQDVSGSEQWLRNFSSEISSFND